MNLDTAHNLFEQLTQELEIALKAIEANLAEKNLLKEEELRLHQLSQELDERADRLDKQQTDLDAQKSHNATLNQKMVEREEAVKRDKILANQLMQEVEIIKQELADRADDIEKRESLLKQQEEVDRQRKEILDVKERKVKERIKQFQIIEGI